MPNLFNPLPDSSPDEIFETLFKDKNVTIERIVSMGQTTAMGEWLSQSRAEWVILLKGSARVVLAKGNKEYVLNPGDYLHIPSGASHRVSWTAPQEPTVWLAVHF